ncbi:MAG: M56 family metallopeptidase [Isosphaeraceae bacterium]
MPTLWLIGSPLTFAWMAAGLAGAERLRWASRPVADPSLLSRLQSLAGACGVARKVALATCDRLAGPVLVGILRPAILLPASALTGWTPEQLEMALRHELIHVRRWDNLVNLVQRSIESLLFFHPAVWMVSGWIRTEREHCCDAEVVRLTGRPEAYAEALLATASAKRIARPASVAMADSNLVGRIRQLLNPEENAMKLPRLPIALAGVLLVAPMVGMVVWARMASPPESMAESKVGGAGLARKAIAEALKGIDGKNGYDDVLLLSQIAEAQVELGDREAAAETWKWAADAALNAQYTGRSIGGRFIDWPWARIGLAEVARSQLSAGEKSKALATYQKAVETQADFEALRGRINADKAIAKGFGQLGALGDARALAERAEREIVGVGITQSDPLSTSYVPGLWVAAQEYGAAFEALDKLASELPEEKLDVRAMLDGSLPNGRQGFLHSAINDMASMTEGADSAKVRPFLAKLADRMALLGNPLEGYLSGLNPFIESLARTGDLDHIRQFALASKDRDGCLRGFLIIARQHRLAGDLEKASEAVAEGLKAAKERPKKEEMKLPPELSRYAEEYPPWPENPLPLDEVVDELVQQGDLLQALAIVQEIAVGERYDPLRLLALEFRREGKEDRAKALFGEALADAEIARNDPPITERTRDALEKFGGIDKHRSFRRDRAQRAIAAIQAQLGRFDVARKAADSMTEPVLRVRAIEEVIGVEAQVGRAAEAYAWIQKLDIPGGKSDLLTTLALWAKAMSQPTEEQPPTPAPQDQDRENASPPQDNPGPDQARLDLIREVLAFRKASGIPLTTEEQRAVARSLVKLGDRPGAWAFLRQEAEHAERSGMSLRSAYVRIARVQREAGDQEGALASYRRAARDEDNAWPDPQRIYAFSTITRAFSDLGSKEDAREAARRCVEEVGRFEKPEDRRPLIPYIADCWAGARDLDQAFASLEAIDQRPGPEPEARKLRGVGLARMAESYPQDDRPAAREAYGKIEAASRVGLGWAERNGVQAAVARGLAGIGDVDGALRLARSIGDEEQPDPDPALDRAKAIHSLYGAVARLPEPERRAARSLLQPAIREALDVVLALDLPSIEVSLLSSIGTTLSSLGDFDSALRAAEALPPGDRVVLLQVISIGQRRDGEEQASRRTFQKALDDIEYRRVHPRPPKQGRPPVSPDQETAFRIADTRALQGDFEEARKVAMTIEDPASRWRALGNVVAMQAQLGDGRAALEWCRANPAPQGVPDPMEGLLINLSFFRSEGD